MLPSVFFFKKLICSFPVGTNARNNAKLCVDVVLLRARGRKIWCGCQNSSLMILGFLYLTVISTLLFSVNKNGFFDIRFWYISFYIDGQAFTCRFIMRREIHENSNKTVICMKFVGSCKKTVKTL